MMRPAFYSAVRAVGTDPAHSPMLHCCDSFGASAFAFAQVEAFFINCYRSSSGHGGSVTAAEMSGTILV
jgi:hypothetical protein